jgi:putative transposase
VERLHGQRFESIRAAKDENIAWLLRYNRTQTHSTLNYVSPMQFEQDWTDRTMTIAAREVEVIEAGRGNDGL